MSNACQDFIDDLSRCEIPDYSDNYDVSSDSECTTFLTEKFNYSQCYQEIPMIVERVGRGLARQGLWINIRKRPFIGLDPDIVR